MNNDKSYDGLIDTLLGIQKALRWGDAAMADALGITRSYWVMLRQGQRQPGRKVLVGVIKAFPQLEEDALLFLREF